MYASRFGHLAAVQALLADGRVEVNIQDEVSGAVFCPYRYRTVIFYWTTAEWSNSPHSCQPIWPHCCGACAAC